MRARFFAPESILKRPVGEIDRQQANRAVHEPALEPRDEAVFLLTAAAEIEHALMVQYLFAAYSIRISSESRPDLMRIQNRILQIAREEMGHLLTVENLLHLIGGPLNFNREHSPYASEIYPFRFKLEPLSLDTLAKYVVAESPVPLPDGFPEGDTAIYQSILERARRSNDGEELNHVGQIFERLEMLFNDAENGLKDEDFRVDTTRLQGSFRDWGYEPSAPSLGERLIVETVDGSNATELRGAAVRAGPRYFFFGCSVPTGAGGGPASSAARRSGGN